MVHFHFLYLGLNDTQFSPLVLRTECQFNLVCYLIGLMLVRLYIIKISKKGALPE